MAYEWLATVQANADPDITTESPVGPIDWTQIVTIIIGFALSGVISGLVLHYMGAGEAG